MITAHRAPVGLGVLGARSFVATRAVMPAADASDLVEIVAVASRSGPVPARWRHLTANGYEAVLADPRVDAVYLPLPNGMHETWARRAAAAGKHVLCEKPLAVDAAAARRMADACRHAGVLLAEAWMTPFGDRWTDGVRRAQLGGIGRVRAVESAFTFTIPPEAAANYRWDPDEGGGALADVGIYCLGPAVELFGPDPADVRATATLAPSGVDAAIDVELDWTGDRRARARCSFLDDERQLLRITGSDGTIELTDQPHTGGDPYRPMLDAFAAAVRGATPWPRPVERSIELLALLDRIRDSTTNDDTLTR